jgi:RimJ/RimL family protein N-acetyltransferase
MIPTLSTTRLTLSPLQISDAPQIQALFPQWEIVRLLDRRIPWPYPDDGALTYCRDIALPAIERGDECHWTLRLHARPTQIIGVISLFKNVDNNRGFWIATQFQRRGLMTEAVEAVNEFWFETLQRPVLRVAKAAANIGSRRISEKTGMRLVAFEERDYVSGQLPSEIWEMTREEWHARHNRQRTI